MLDTASFRAGGLALFQLRKTLHAGARHLVAVDKSHGSQPHFASWEYSCLLNERNL